MNVSYYSAPLSQFLVQSDAEILGILTEAHHFALEEALRDAWSEQIASLKMGLRGLSEGEIHFEFAIPRMGKRADCMLLLKNIVFALEYKVGSSTFERHAIEQVYDYALDLKNFHRGSHEAVIVPILIATRAHSETVEPQFAPDNVAAPIMVGTDTLRQVIELTCARVTAPLLPQDWANSGYQPTPTIIEAAQALYETHEVTNIARSDAGAMNLAATDKRISDIIEMAKREGHKAICFITGVPGAGKTLAGLNIATRRAADHSDENAVFLSGNGPLVKVLCEALVRDKCARNKVSGCTVKKSDVERDVNAFIQNIHHFRDEYLRDPHPPFEKVVVFDEAQRAWTRDQASKFMKTKRGQENFDQSEPEFLISVMDRHQDWAVIVCLIGGGQEINTGEAGLGEWLTALRDRFPHWQVHASSLLANTDYTVSKDARKMLDAPSIIHHPDLHLNVSMRSFRAETLNGFISALLDGDVSRARTSYAALKNRYPIRLTRSLEAAREWLRSTARGSERYGVIASSGAYRLRPEGIQVKNSIDPADWFLNDRDDVRSSFYLEEAGTEFDVQGLELDWSCLAWDADLRWNGDGWKTQSFRGTTWQNVNSEERRLYLINAYRVLLTRARQGMVIFVPEGSEQDFTRLPSFYDPTYRLLLGCGLECL